MCSGKGHTSTVMENTPDSFGKKPKKNKTLPVPGALGVFPSRLRWSCLGRGFLLSSTVKRKYESCMTPSYLYQPVHSRLQVWHFVLMLPLYICQNFFRLLLLLHTWNPKQSEVHAGCSLEEGLLSHFTEALCEQACKPASVCCITNTQVALKKQRVESAAFTQCCLVASQN